MADAGNDTRPGPRRAVADCEVQAAAGEVRKQTDPRAAGAASTRGAQPSPRQLCGYCWKPIKQQRNGAWYHRRNASTSCRPGEGSDRRAFPGGLPAR